MRGSLAGHRALGCEEMMAREKAEGAGEVGRDLAQSHRAVGLRGPLEVIQPRPPAAAGSHRTHPGGFGTPPEGRLHRPLGSLPWGPAHFALVKFFLPWSLLCPLPLVLDTTERSLAPSS